MQPLIFSNHTSKLSSLSHLKISLLLHVSLCKHPFRLTLIYFTTYDCISHFFHSSFSLIIYSLLLTLIIRHPILTFALFFLKTLQNTGVHFFLPYTPFLSAAHLFPFSASRSNTLILPSLLYAYRNSTSWCLSHCPSSPRPRAALAQLRCRDRRATAKRKGRAGLHN